MLRTLVLLLTLTIGVAAVWKFTRSGEPGGKLPETVALTPLVISDQPDGVDAAANGQEGNEVGESSTGPLAVSEMDPVTSDAEGRSSTIDPPTDYIPIKPELQQHMDDAVAGVRAEDRTRAIRLANYLRECRSVPGTEADLRRRLQSWSRMDFQKPINFSMGDAYLTANDQDDLRQQMTTLFTRCSALRQNIDQNFHEEITRMAMSGNPAARFVYAMWRPPESHADFHAWPLWLEYEERALQFTWENIEEGEPLGVLALAYSYLAGMSSYFTPRNDQLGRMLLITAVKCGATESTMDQGIDKALEAFNRMQARFPDAMSDMNAATDDMARTFCHLQ